MKKAVVMCSLMLLTLESFANDNNNIFTLKEILERVLMVSPNLEVLNKELDVSESQVKKARSQKFPRLEVEAISGGIFSTVRGELFQPLYTFGKISAAETAAKKGVEATTAKISEAQTDTVEQAKKAYYNLQLAYALKDLSIEGRDRVKKTFDKVEELLNGGSPKATQTDKLKLTVLLSSMNKNVVSSEKAVELAKDVLKRMLRIEGEAAFDIDSHSLEPIEFEPKGLNYYVEALKERPQVREIEVGLEAKRSSIQEAKSKYYPTFFAGGTISYNTSPLYRDTVLGGVGIGIKQVLSFSTSADLSEAQADYSKSLKEKDVALQEIDFEVKKTYLDMKESGDNLDYDKEGFRAARTLLSNATSNYDLGIGNVNDLINALETFLREGEGYYQTVFSYNISVAHLEKVTGGLEKGLK